MKNHHHLLIINLPILLSFFSSPLEAKVSTSTIDLLPLLSFKSQISEDPFEVLSSWNNSVHYCQWQGVMCGRYHPNRVTALILDSKQLSGYISPFLANLTFLKRINLSNNHLEGTIPMELGHLGRLRFVSLSGNFLDGSIPSTLGNCSKLEVIALRHNNLHGTIPSNLGLGANRLKGTLPFDMCDALPNLQFLFLYQNQLEGQIPPSISNCSALYDVELDSNHFSGIIPSSLSIRLDLSNNYLTDILSSEVGNLKNLQTIRLSNNKLFGELPSEIGGCQELQALYLDNNLFQGTIPSTMSNLGGLQILDISNNLFSGQIPYSSEC